MSKVNKYQGQRTLEISVSDYVLRNLSSGVETYMDTVQSENLTKSVSTTKIKAGINNDTIASIDSDTTIELEIVDAISRPELVNAKWNSQDKTGVIVKTAMPRPYIVATGKTIQLDQVPLSADDIVIYKNNLPLIKTTDYTIADNIITIKNTEVQVGHSLFISSYSYTGTAGDYFEVGEGSNSMVYEIIQRKPIFNDKLEIIKYRYRHFGKATLSSEASEEGKTERENQPITYMFSIEKNPDLPYVFRTWYADK